MSNETIKQAKDAVLDRIQALAETTSTNASDTILLTDALTTVDKSVDETTKINPAPDYHYRNTRPEYGIWSSHHGHGGGGTIVDELAYPIKMRGYWHHNYEDTADGTWTGVYCGGMKEQYSANNCYYRCNDHCPSGTECYLNGTTSVGELGHYRMIMGYRALETTRVGAFGDNYRHENFYVGNAELGSRECYLKYEGQTVSLRMRHLAYDHTALSSYDTNNNSNTNRGGLSYNKTVQELVVLNRKGSTSTFTTKIFKNIPEITRKTNLGVILPAAEAGSASLDFVLADGYLVGDLETYENNKIVLCDDKTMYVTTHEPSTQLHIAKLTRDAGDTTLTYSDHAQQPLGSPTYGQGNNAGHGHMLVQSRDKKNIFLFTPYYQYQRGMVSYIVSKDLNSYATGFNWTTTTHGANVGPYGDRGFAISRNHNWDWPGAQSMKCWIQKETDGTWIETDTGGQIDNNGWWTTMYPCLVPLNY
jgi:hypothetical protein|tara:strand:+ start:1226 stop:2650 length:1425 start_codon:yes stop_codon:yes gene_type:complete